MRKAKSKPAARCNKQEQLAAFKTDSLEKKLTTNQGIYINDNQNSLKSSERGATLLEDFILREKITHFDHERIPERIVHARGSGAHGYFQVYKNLEAFTSAGFLTHPTRITPVFARFSTVAGGAGSSDLARDIRGFAVKFYTEEGVFDLVGNNVPVFFIQDAIKFPDLVHAVKMEPHNGIPQAASAHDNFWDFISLMPESMHTVMWAMSDRALPRSFRMMEGFGVHTFKLVNKKGKAHFVKFHWKPLLGVHAVAWDEAQKISGRDSDFHRRDLWEAIENGAFPEWELGLQIIPEKNEHLFEFDLLDPTKLIPEELVPVQRVGKMVLNRNPDNFFAETEQVAFHPGHLVPGIDFTNDPLLQGRLFSYTDTQLSRLGSPNFHELPINRSVSPVHNNQRDGHMRQNIAKGRVNYEPNTLAGGCPYQSKLKEGGFFSHTQRENNTKTRTRSKSFTDHYSQARLFYNSQSVYEQNHIRDAFIFELSKVNTPAVRERVVGLLVYIDKRLANAVGAHFGIKPETPGQANQSIPAGINPQTLQSRVLDSTIKTSAALSMAGNTNGTIATRKIAFLVADGVNGKMVQQVKNAMEKQGAVVAFVAPDMAPVIASDKTIITPSHSITSTASVCFDAVFVTGGEVAAARLAAEPPAIFFINEAYKHCKAIAWGKGTDVLFKATFIAQKTHTDRAVLYEQDKLFLASFIKAIAAHRVWDLEEVRNNPS